VPLADFVTTTTHKSLRGPRGGIIICKERFAKGIDGQVFPGIQGGPLEHVIAAKAVCFYEALQPSFKGYAQQIVSNARALAAGLIAAGVYPNPVPHADFVTTTTHKSLRGPRGGVILMKAEFEKQINSAIFPGIQGGPLMHVIAAKAVAFKEALSPEFKAYQQQVVENARVLAETLVKRGLRIVSGRTESHVMLVDLRAKKITGKAAEAALGAAHITVNKNAIPNDPEKPFVTSGIRLGSPAMTTRGFGVKEAEQVGNLIADVLDNPEDAATIERVRAQVAELTQRFPVYG
ncbi:MAG TPA: hypothetical protein VHV99_12040, partial [Paraburkholderia sp.]|nr:hypothetical protein [Paraburkholderia sp.]